MTTKLKKWGNSYGIRIPKEIVDKMEIEEDSEIDLQVSAKGLIVKPLKTKKQKNTKYSLKKLLKDFESKTKHREFDWGEPVGQEIW